ncbi:MAG: DUF4442 domain-containing protein [Acidobacteriota bacterium]
MSSSSPSTLTAAAPAAPRAADPEAGLAAAARAAAFDHDKIAKLQKRLTNPWLMRAFLLGRLPLGFMASLRVKSIDTERCQTTVPYGWRTQNPFRSTYFAAQAMAAELSTGALAMLAVESAPHSVAMLITGLESTFGKKATDLTTFTCEDGAAIFDAVVETLATGEPATARASTVGRMPDGVEVSRFTFEWSFKKRGHRA